MTTNNADYRMTLKRFREITKDLPENAIIVVLAPEGSSANRELIDVTVLESQQRYTQHRAPDEALDEKTTLIRLQPARG